MAITIRSDVIDVDPETIPNWYRDLRGAQYPYVVSLCILVYDCLITMDKEIKYFWKIPRSIVDVIYFINRYIAIFGAAVSLFYNSFGVNSTECNLAAWAPAVYSWVNVTLIDYILLIRVLALYSREKRLLIPMKVLFLLDALVTCGCVIYTNSSTSVAIARVHGNVTACVFLAGLDLPPAEFELSLVIWIIPIVFGTILMLLALYKAVGLWKMSAGLKGLPLVRIVIKDQLIYFAFAISCCTINLAQQIGVAKNFILDAYLINLGNTVFLAILGSRMLYNIKDAAEKRQNIGSDFYRTLPYSIGDIEFADLPNAPPDVENKEYSDCRKADRTLP